MKLLSLLVSATANTPSGRRIRRTSSTTARVRSRDRRRTRRRRTRGGPHRRTACD
jgi:hypothetical protein